MTDDTAVTIHSAESIERGKATRPLRIDETTRQEIDSIDGVLTRVDTVFVPWDSEEPIDRAEVLFTVDENVLMRRDIDTEDVVKSVIAEIEADHRTSRVIVWGHIDPHVNVASIDDERTRVHIKWGVNPEGGDE